MAEPTVWTFFYGSFINLDVLNRAGYVPGGHGWAEELARRVVLCDKVPRKTLQTLLANALSKWP
jgi:hypothetical protein